MPQLARKTARWISNKRSGAAGEAGRRLHDRRKRHGDFRQSASHLIILVAPAASRVLRASGLQAGRVSSFPQLQHLSHHVVFVKSCHCINMDLCLTRLPDGVWILLEGQVSIAARVWC